MILFCIILFSAVSVYAVDYYTNKNKDDKDTLYLYSPRKERPEFMEGDIKDIKEFAQTITNKGKPENLTALITKNLSDETKQLIKEYQSKKNPPESLIKSLEESLIKDLNKIISQESLYTKERFEDINLDQQTQKLLKLNLKKGNKLLAYLNRSLLQYAYPKSLVSWEFFEENLDPHNPKLYDKAIRPYWRRKIIYNELPYKYIERKYNDATVLNDSDIQFNLSSGFSLKINLNGEITPQSTGRFYEYKINQKINNIGNLTGKVTGRKIGKRINLSFNLNLHNDKEKKIGDITGSVTYGLSEKDNLENGTFAFFLRLEKPEKNRPFMDYFRIQGSVKGHAKSTTIEASIEDVDGREVDKISGSWNLQKLMLF